METRFDIDRLLITIGIMAGVALILALVLLIYILWRVRRIKLPPDADFITALRYTPLVVVVMIDLLDLSLDFLSAPISWVILGKLGLQPLRGVSLVESIIPGTQVLPTLTISWVIARLWKNIPHIPSHYP